MHGQRTHKNYSVPVDTCTALHGGAHNNNNDNKQQQKSDTQIGRKVKKARLFENVYAYTRWCWWWLVARAVSRQRIRGGAQQTNEIHWH